MGISKEDMKTLVKAQRGEMDAVLMYKRLAKIDRYPEVEQVMNDEVFHGDAILGLLEK